MKTIEELASGATSSSDIATQVQQWREEILKAARANRKFEQVIRNFDVPDGVKDLKIPYTSSGTDFSAEEVTSENTQVTFTDLTGQISSWTFTPSYRRNAVRISLEAIEENAVDVMAFAREELTEYATTKVDSEIQGLLEDIDGHATVSASDLAGGAVIYPGSASDVSGLASGDVLTPDLLAESFRALKSEHWESEGDAPFVVFIAPEQEEALMKDSQFVNAAEYGSNEPVLNGEIGKYLGAKIITTTQVPSYSGTDTDETTAGTWPTGVSGHSVYVVKSQEVAGIAWAKEAEIAVEEKLDYNEQRIYLGMKFDVEFIHPDALAIIKATDS